MDPTTLRQHVRTLAAEPRPPGSAALRRARDWCEARLSEAGWSVRREPFTLGDLSGINLVAEPAGAEATPRWIVAAHLDSRPETPGADDNASAVAALIESARALGCASGGRPLSPRAALRLLVTDLEECGMLGAQHHAEHLRAAGADLRGVVALEMLGHRDPRPGSQRMPEALRSLYPDTGDFIGVVGNAASQTLIDEIAAGLRTVADLRVETLTVSGRGEAFPATRLSDHSPFWDLGFRAVMVTDTSFFRNPHYHKPSDTPDTLDYVFLAQVTEGLISALRGLVGVQG